MSTTTTTTKKLHIMMCGGTKPDLTATARVVYYDIPSRVHYCIRKNAWQENKTDMTGGMITDAIKRADPTFAPRWFALFSDEGEGIVQWCELTKIIAELDATEHAPALGAPTEVLKCDYQSPGAFEVIRYRGARGWRRWVQDEMSDDPFAVKPYYYTETEMLMMIQQGYKDKDNDDPYDLFTPIPEPTATEKKIKAAAKECGITMYDVMMAEHHSGSFMRIEGNTYKFYQAHKTWCKKHLKYQWDGKGSWDHVDGGFWQVPDGPRKEVCTRVFEYKRDVEQDRKEDMEDHPEKYLSAVLIDLIHQRTPLFAKDVLWQTPYVSDDIMHRQIIGALLTELRCPQGVGFKEFGLMVATIVKSIEIDRTPYIEMCEANGGHTTDEDLELTNPEALM